MLFLFCCGIHQRCEPSGFKILSAAGLCCAVNVALKRTTWNSTADAALVPLGHLHFPMVVFAPLASTSSNTHGNCYYFLSAIMSNVISFSFLSSPSSPKFMSSEGSQASQEQETGKSVYCNDAA